MTLRGSEQSLSHNPVHAGIEARARDHAPLFSRILFLSATLLTATIWFALSALDQFNASLIHSSRIEPIDIQNHAANQNTHSSQAGNIGDVIITPENTEYANNLKQLTHNYSGQSASPFEIPIAEVMEILSNSKAGNISVSPGLKFYPTANANFIRACPETSNPFDQATGVNAHQTRCFFIETTPAYNDQQSGPHIL